MFLKALSLNDGDGGNKRQLQNLLRQAVACAYGRTTLCYDGDKYYNNDFHNNPKSKKSIQKEKI